MRINDDFSCRASVTFAEDAFVPSPMAGVERLMLDRIGDEVARATSLVRFAPGSAFSAHTHGGGEEFLVLEGVFQDETGDYPAGSYVRNPPTSRHTPRSAPGCVIFVKLWQFDPDDRAGVTVTPDADAFAPVDGEAGTTRMPLYADPHEMVALERWAPDTTVTRTVPSGTEILVVDGTLIEGGETLTGWSWLRLPPGTSLNAKAGPQGCRLWIKTGHLTAVSAPRDAA